MLERVSENYNQIKDCRYGKMMFNVNDTYVGNAFNRYGEWSYEELDLLSNFIQPGDIALDIGANIGAHTVFFSKAVGPSGLVYAFEPQQYVFQLLCANIALNCITNTITYPHAVGDSIGSVRVPCYDPSYLNNFGGTSVGGDEGDAIPMVTIDSLPIDQCNLIKIDVEGMEYKVLLGAYKTLKAFKPVLYVENDRPEHSQQIIGYLTALGYRLYHHRPKYYNPQNYFQNPENVFFEEAATNLLCLPAGSPFQVEALEAV